MPPLSLRAILAERVVCPGRAGRPTSVAIGRCLHLFILALVAAPVTIDVTAIVTIDITVRQRGDEVGAIFVRIKCHAAGINLVCCVYFRNVKGTWLQQGLVCKFLSSSINQLSLL